MQIGDHAFLLDVSEDYEPNQSGAADFTYYLYQNASQVTSPWVNMFYSNLACNTISEYNYYSVVKRMEYKQNNYYPPSYNNVKCVIGTITINSNTNNQTTKVFSVKKVLTDTTKGITQGQNNLYFYEYTPSTSNQLSFTDMSGQPFYDIYLYAYTLRYTNLFEQMNQVKINVTTKNGYNYVQIPSQYQHSLIGIVNSDNSNKMYVGFGDYNPYSKPEPEKQIHIIEQNSEQYFVNPQNDITTYDTLYVYKLINMSKFENESDFGYFPMMTKYQQQTISIYQTKYINTTNITENLQSIQPNQYNLYLPTSDNKYLIVESQPKIQITQIDKYGINKAYYNDGYVTPHFFFVMKNKEKEISQIKFGINTDQQLPEILIAKMYTSYDFDNFINVTSIITKNDDGNYYQFTNQLSDQICILELKLQTEQKIKLVTNDNIPYDPPYQQQEEEEQQYEIEEQEELNIENQEENVEQGQEEMNITEEQQEIQEECNEQYDEQIETPEENNYESEEQQIENEINEEDYEQVELELESEEEQQSNEQEFEQNEHEEQLIINEELEQFTEEEIIIEQDQNQHNNSEEEYNQQNTNKTARNTIIAVLIISAIILSAGIIFGIYKLIQQKKIKIFKNKQQAQLIVVTQLQQQILTPVQLGQQQNISDSQQQENQQKQIKKVKKTKKRYKKQNKNQH